MTEDWDYYPCRLDHDRASIYLNLGLAAVAPVATHSHLVMVSVAMLDPREDGLSSDAESQALMALEDDLYAYARGASVIYCGRLTARGSRVFYFFAAAPDTFAHRVDAAMLLHADYQHRVTTQADGDWSLYARFLYPSPEDYQCMQRRRLN